MYELIILRFLPRLLRLDALPISLYPSWPPLKSACDSHSDSYTCGVPPKSPDHSDVNTARIWRPFHFGGKLPACYESTILLSFLN